MTDVDFLLSVLSDGEPHTNDELLRRSIAERGCGLMIHSRVADLRARGHQITCEHVKGEKRGRAWRYRLVDAAGDGEQAAGEKTRDRSQRGLAVSQSASASAAVSAVDDVASSFEPDAGALFALPEPTRKVRELWA